jgi:hypothetical protein
MSRMSHYIQYRMISKIQAERVIYIVPLPPIPTVAPIGSVFALELRSGQTLNAPLGTTFVFQES